MNFEKRILAGGRAVLYRGDSLALLADGLLKADALVSDPPYGIGFQHGSGGRGFEASKHKDKIVGHYETACHRIERAWAEMGGCSSGATVTP